MVGAGERGAGNKTQGEGELLEAGRRCAAAPLFHVSTARIRALQLPLTSFVARRRAPASWDPRHRKCRVCHPRRCDRRRCASTLDVATAAAAAAAAAKGAAVAPVTTTATMGAAAELGGDDGWRPWWSVVSGPSLSRPALLLKSTYAMRTPVRNAAV